MSKVIEVYIRNEEVLTRPTLIQGVPGHPCAVKESLKSERIIPEADRLALEVAKEVPTRTELELKVYDISSFSEKIRSRLRGVKNTPTIIVGKRIEGTPARDDLLPLIR